MPKSKPKTVSKEPEPPKYLGRVELYPACLCKDGPDIGVSDKKTGKFTVLPGPQRMEDGSVIPHVHPWMAKANDLAQRRAMVVEKEDDVKQLPLGANGWDPGEYENQMGV